MPSACETWAFLRGIEWKNFPESGGYLDQDARLMSAIGIVQWRYDRLKAHDEANKQQSESDKKKRRKPT